MTALGKLSSELQGKLNLCTVVQIVQCQGVLLSVFTFFDICRSFVIGVSWLAYC